MEELNTVSRIVDETDKEQVDNCKPSAIGGDFNTVVDTPCTDTRDDDFVLSKQHNFESLVKQSLPSKHGNGEITSGTTFSSRATTLDIVNEMESQKKTEHIDATVQMDVGNTTPKESRSLKTPPGYMYWKKDSFLKKVKSEPALLQGGFDKVLYYDNPSFQETRKTAKRTSFVDVVTEVIQEPIKCDIHPYGRGPVYLKALGGDQTKIHTEEGKLFMWVLTTIIVLGVAVGVIAMSQMYQTNRYVDWGPSTTNSTTEFG